MSHEHVLVVDDEKLIRYTLRESLAEEGYVVHEAGDVAEAQAQAERHRIDCAILDHKLPDGDGFELMKTIVELHPEVPVILMTAYSSVQKAVEAMRRGAFTYVNKPFDTDEMVVNVRSALETTRLRREVHALRRLQADEGLGAVIGDSPQMREISELLRTLASSRANTVLLLGESGTGKGLLANALHESSERKDKPFLTITCTAIPENLLESELFGHERGAFTDAKAAKPGLFEVADGGTVFLDEIGDMPLGLQAKLLSVLEDKRFKRLGGVADIEVDIRVVAATNADLDELVRSGAFRLDLFYRLNTFPIHIPPLRERVEDIPILAAFFLDRFNREFNKTIEGIDDDAMNLLQTHNWPGNVRELRNALERAYIVGNSVITLKELPPLDDQAIAQGEYLRVSVGSSLDDSERRLIFATLDANAGDKKRTARVLGISLKTLYNRLNRYAEDDGGSTSEGA